MGGCHKQVLFQLGPRQGSNSSSESPFPGYILIQRFVNTNGKASGCPAVFSCQHTCQTLNIHVVVPVPCVGRLVLFFPTCDFLWLFWCALLVFRTPFTGSPEGGSDVTATGYGGRRPAADAAGGADRRLARLWDRYLFLRSAATSHKPQATSE
jgi:hypothetical protein